MKKLIKSLSIAILFISALWFMNLVSFDSIFGIVPIIFFIIHVLGAFINYHKQAKMGGKSD